MNYIIQNDAECRFKPACSSLKDELFHSNSKGHQSIRSLNLMSDAWSLAWEIFPTKGRQIHYKSLKKNPKISTAAVSDAFGHISRKHKSQVCQKNFVNEIICALLQPQTQAGHKWHQAVWSTRVMFLVPVRCSFPFTMIYSTASLNLWNH